MKLKTKFMIAVAMIIFAICLFNANTVNAVEVPEELQHMLDVLPTEIKIDLPESECDKGYDIINKKINDIWKNNNFPMEEIKNKCYLQYNPIYGAYRDNDSIHKATIIAFGSVKAKEISIKYNNSDKRNNADEQYVKSLKVSRPSYIEIDIDAINTDDYIDDLFKCVENYYRNIIRDNSVELKVRSSAGWLEYGIFAGLGEGSPGLGIFKNGILYNVIEVPRNAVQYFVPVIKVPNTIADDELNNYVLNYINNIEEKRFNENATKYAKCNLKKGASRNGTTIPDGYTMTLDDNSDNFEIIIKREKATIETTNTVTKTDNNTNIKLETTEGVIPSNTILEVKSITEGTLFDKIKNIISNVNKFKIFDINLLSNGAKIQPNGKVKISIPIPEGFDTSKLIVYRIEDNGNKVEYNVTVKDNYATFETDHFSNYVLAELTETKAENTETKQGEKDNTPKTGIETNNIVAYTIGLIAIVGIGMLIISRKNS